MTFKKKKKLYGKKKTELQKKMVINYSFPINLHLTIIRNNKNNRYTYTYN